MKPTELLGVFTTFILGMYGVYRLARQDHRKASSDNAAALLNGWQQLQESVVRDVDRVRAACAKEISDLKAKFEVDRADLKAKFEVDRADLKARFAADQAEWHAERLALQTCVDDLQALVNRPTVARTRRSDLAAIARIIDGDSAVADTKGATDV